MRNLKSKKNFKIVLLLATLVFLTFQFTSVLADSVSNNNYTLEADKTYAGTGFFSGDNINIKGKVEGTSFIAGSNIDVSGLIDGDLFIAGNNITVSATVNGSVITAGYDIDISGNVANNIYSSGSKITLEPKTVKSAFLAGDKISVNEKSIIEKDLFIGGSQIFQKGEVLRSFFGSADNISISGLIGKNVKLDANDVYVENAEIKGDLKYDSVNKATISKDSNILGKTQWNEIKPEPKPKVFSLSVLIKILISIINLLIVWFIIKLVRPRFWTNLANNIRLNPLKSLGFGALALIVTPTAIFFLIIAIVIYPVAFLLAALYGLAIYISKIIVSVFIGEWLENKFKWKYRHKGFWTTLLGLVILSLLGIIPIVGLLVNLLTIVLGLGSIVLYVTNNSKVKQ